MRLLFLFCGLFVPLFVFAQESETDRLVMQLRSISLHDQPDSIILVYQNLQKTDRKEARNSRNQLTLMQAYLGKDDIRAARRMARKIYRKPAVGQISYSLTRRMITKHFCSESLYRYYESKNDTKNAVKYLVKAVDRYPITGCSTGKRSYKFRNYKIIADYYTQLGKPRKAEKYLRKQKAV